MDNPHRAVLGYFSVMDKPSPPDVAYAAPGAGASSHALYLPGAMRHADYPAVDDRAVRPETGTEMIRGEVRRVLPAESPHADRQCDIAYVLRSEVAPGYVASTELLTRVDGGSDFATDACVRKAGRDPATGTRYLEELAFEVKHTQRTADLTERARKLVRRGVRRVFVIAVKEGDDGKIEAGPVQEWLAGEDRWRTLAPADEIVDRCLVQPVKVQALLDVTEANDQVARALLAKNNPVLVKDRQEALAAQARAMVEDKQEALAAQARALSEAHARELRAREDAHARALRAREAAHARELQAREAAHARAAILELCDVLAIEVTAERQARMAAMTSEELDTLRTTIRTGRRWPEERQGPVSE